VPPQNVTPDEICYFSGSLKPVVDSVFSFDDTLKAYDRIMSGRATGKVIVKVDPSVE